MTITAEALFQLIAEIIAHPHTTITKHDKKQALEVLNLIDYYLHQNFCIVNGDLQDTMQKIEKDFYFEDHPEERNVVKDWNAIAV